MPTVPHDLFKRFFERVDRDSHPGGCWLWTGYNGHSGYGMLWVKIGDDKARNHRANRLSYLIHTGDIPDGMFVCHRCDNPACVNPDHLFLGWPADNTDDMINKGRHPRMKRRPPSNQKLSDSDAAHIRRLIEDGIGVTEIARRFGVSQATISYIKSGRLHPVDKGTKRIGSVPALTVEQQREILVLRAQGIPSRILAQRYGVARQTIDRVISGKYPA